jgi:fumarylpyruvate hydrolase
MADYVFQPPPPPAVETTDGRLVPIRRIFCVGRNYAAHAREMGRDPDREPPFFFTKPGDAVVPSGSDIPYPKATANLHHEIELVAVIGRTADGIGPDHAVDRIFGYGVGIDLTRRDLQLEARETGRPWDTGKAFDQSAVCGAVSPAAESGHPDTGAIWLDVNGERRQSGDLAELIWSVPEVVSILSSLFVLRAGDLIYTGTPAGVGALSVGDEVRGGVEGFRDIQVRIT